MRGTGRSGSKRNVRVKSSKGKKHAAMREMELFARINQHPAFLSNSLGAIKAHLMATTQDDGAPGGASQ